MDWIKNNKWLLFIIIIIVSLLIAGLVIIKNKNSSYNFFNGLGEYKTLKKEDISSIPDDELVYAVMSWMWSKFNSDWSNQFDVVSSLPIACQDIYSVYTIEAEVNNGGFNQCYFNSSKEYTIMAENGFKAIGAVGFLDIMTRANLIYSDIKDDLEKFNDGTIESFSESYENNPLNDLDDDFYKMYEEEPLNELCVKYIRANWEYFGN